MEIEDPLLRQPPCISHHHGLPFGPKAAICIVLAALLVVSVIWGSPPLMAVWDPLGIATPPTVTAPAPLPKMPVVPQIKPQSHRAVPTAMAATSAGVIASTAGAWAAQLQNTPNVANAAIDGSPWLPPIAVTTFLAVALAGTVITTVFQIVTAQEGVRTETVGGSISAKKKSGDMNTEEGLKTIGMRKVLDEDMPMWKVRLQLTKPVTWVPLICGVACGTAASGNFHWWNPFTVGQPGHIPFSLAATDMMKVLVAMFMSGPLLTGYTQTINDWYDREIDAINEPYRAIPSGRISEPQVIAQIWVLLLAGIAVAMGLDYWAGHWFDGYSGVFLGTIQIPPITANAILGSFIAYIYSAPPLKLKQSGWIGDYACGASYIALPWWCGQSLFGELNPGVMVLSVLYSIAGLGVAIVNDFKSMEGDRIKGLMSLTVMYGMERAKWICAGTIDVTQLAVALYLAYIGETNYAIALFGLIVPQMWAQFRYLLKDPIKYDVKYQVNALPFFASGIFCTALAMAHHQQLLSSL